MSVNDETSLPWLTREKRLITASLDAGKRILGVCLGAQLLASALGARVYRAGQREFGWFPVRTVPTSRPVPVVLPAQFDAFHWHGETFDVPSGAVRLAETPACPNQAFSYGTSALGLQFHLEATAESVADFVRHCGHEIGHQPFAPQTELAGTPERFEALEAVLFGMFDRMAG